jgi:hypothetical protein
MRTNDISRGRNLHVRQMIRMKLQVWEDWIRCPNWLHWWLPVTWTFLRVKIRGLRRIRHRPKLHLDPCPNPKLPFERQVRVPVRKRQVV